MENNQHGGLDTFCSTLLNAWPDPGDSFVFVCNASHPGRETVQRSVTVPCEFVTHNVPLSWVLSKRLLGWLPYPFRRASQPVLRILLYLVQYYSLRRIFRGLHGDALLVLNGGYPGGESCRIANIAWSDLDDGKPARRNIHNFHNFAVPPPGGLRWYENWVDRRLVTAAAKLISVSRACAESIRTRKSFRHSEAIDYIYNGIELRKSEKSAEPPDLRAGLGIGDAPLCLILANYEPRKGHRLLFEAFAQVAEALPEAHLVACGGGSEEEREAVEGLRHELAPSANIHLLGFVPGGPQLIDQADLVAISSQSFESFGLTAVEAMARAVPVVATQVGGLPEVVGNDGEGGYTVSADDAAAFADRITWLLRDSTLRQRVGERGIERATLFTAERMAAEYHAALTGEAVPDKAPSALAIHGEWHYVLRRCVVPGMAWESVWVAASALGRRLSNRLLRRRDRLYPPGIRVLARKVQTPNSQPEGVVSPPPDTVPEGPRRLKLATGYLPFESWLKWDTSFNDHEQEVSLHRWNWLLRALTDEDEPVEFTWGVALMRSWLATMSVSPTGNAGESYTVGERIANACLFARETTGRWDALPEDLVNALSRMAADLAQRVEYHGGELSGNHVFNNGRALLLAGHCCNWPELAEMGRELLAERLPVLLEDGAFLREGSSHYQFLFARWVLELRLLAEERNDAETLELLGPQLPRVLEGCCLFRVAAAEGGYFVPNFGDISPDCEPEWLWDLPASPLVRSSSVEKVASNNVRGWATLFADSRLSGVEIPVNGGPPVSPWRAYPQAGWYRLDYRGWVAIWHVESSRGSPIASHAHHDVGAFVLYRHGNEVLIDPGRVDYRRTPLGRYGIGVEAHNSVSLDGRPPMVSRGDRLLPERHRRADCVVSCNQNDEGMTVQIEHNGFARLGGGADRHRRTFIFSDDAVEITDRFKGTGRYWMESRFHRPLSGETYLHGYYVGRPHGFRPELDLTVVKAPPAIRERTLVASEDPIGGWRFPAYGVKEPALTHCFAVTLELPAECRYRLFERGV